MSRRTAEVEEFDDDTELPLPSRPLPNSGTKGAILESLTDDESDSDAPDLLPPRAGPASPSQQQFRREYDAEPQARDPTYKKWTCVYPIYIDAKRAYGTGERRVARSKAVWWPLSKDIAAATDRLGLGHLHEPNKSHPRDWENPGRVRVQWKKDGKPVNPAIKSKKQLLEIISMQIQMLKPDNIPKPPYNLAPADGEAAPAPTPAASKAAAKGKQPASKTAGKGPSSGNAIISSTPAPTKRSGRTLPSPPAPQPPLSSRVSPYSPALVSGVLIETVKAGMSAQEGAAGPGMGGGKGKRKVVRVRG
ncbi:signal recognition particle, SRP19 subunit [Panus rudis PR-1116 ss-1]|nr:signal recognition particle, SRP19 subunit [Panus rudis PR-1116 ss-1]